LLLRLMNAFPPEDPVLAAKSTVDVIISDMPRPRYDTQPIDIGPSVRPPRKEAPPPPAPPIEKVSVNGAKPDPRPRD
jgi:hypothetical protein